MALVRICPTCKTKNKPNAPLCDNDLVDISKICPVDDSILDSVDGTSVMQLTLKLPNGSSIALRDGDVIGREAIGAELLCDYARVSRQHARVTYKDEKWYVEDLGSTNGVYLDGTRIPLNKKIELQDRQKLNLSKSCELVVEIS